MTTPPPIVQLVTRIPRDLRRRVKVHCLVRDTTLTTFVVDAILERLTSQKSSRTKNASRPR